VYPDNPYCFLSAGFPQVLFPPGPSPILNIRYLEQLGGPRTFDGVKSTGVTSGVNLPSALFEISTKSARILQDIPKEPGHVLAVFLITGPLQLSTGSARKNLQQVSHRLELTRGSRLESYPGKPGDLKARYLPARYFHSCARFSSRFCGSIFWVVATRFCSYCPELPLAMQSRRMGEDFRVETARTGRPERFDSK
jgi:hypothetical protein